MNAQQRNNAFSLVELLAVLLIVGLLAGATISLSRYASRKAAESAAKAEIALIEDALERYKLKNGTNISATTANAGAIAILVLTNGYISWPRSKISSTGFNDPYGGVYLYLCPGSRNPNSYDLWTVSADGRTTNSNFGQ